MRMLPRCIFRSALLIVAALVAFPAAADEPDKLLPPDTDAVLKVNVRALFDSPAVKKYALDEIRKGLDQNVHLAVILKIADLDPFKDLESVTFAVAKPQEPKALVIVRGRFNRAQLEGVLDAGVKLDPKKYAVSEYREIKVYQGKDGDGWYGALLDKGTLVTSQHEAMVKKAIDQNLAKGAASLNKELTTILAKVDGKQTIWLAVAGTKAVKDAARNHPDGKSIADQFQGAIVGLTVKDGLGIDLALYTNDPAAVKKMKADLEAGKEVLQAFASAPDYGPILTEILDGASVTADERGALRLRVAISGSAITKIIKLGQQQ